MRPLALFAVVLVWTLALGLSCAGGGEAPSSPPSNPPPDATVPERPTGVACYDPCYA